MKQKNYYTTGQAAKLLNISQSTVSRMFNRNILVGQQNPITRKRLISRESLAAIGKQYQFPVDLLFAGKKKKRILVGTPDDYFFSSVQNTIYRDKRVLIERSMLGGDVLIQCSKEPPDLLVVDEEVSDIPCSRIIQFLRRTEECKNLKILCGLKTQNMKRSSKWGADGVLRKDNIEQEELKEKVYSLLDIPEENPASVETNRIFEYQRRWPRISVDYSAKIWIYRLHQAHVREKGEAKVDDISLGGVHLSEIRLEKGGFPTEPFRVLMEIEQKPFKNWKIHGKVIRSKSNGSVEAGVQFIRLSKPVLQMITTVFEQQAASNLITSDLR